MHDFLNGSRSSRGFALGADGLGRLGDKRLSVFEFVHHPDNGCHLSPSCLACPLPQCVHDLNVELEARGQRVYEEGKARAAQLAAKLGVMMDQGTAKRQAVLQVMREANVSKSTVERAVRRVREGE